MKSVPMTVLAVCTLATALFASAPATAFGSETHNQNKPAAAARPDTPPHDICQNLGGYGWFGISPGQDGDSGMWVDASESASPANLVISPGNGGDDQQWCFVPTGDGASYYIQALYNDTWNCIDVPGGDYTSGTQLLAFPCNQQDNEKWLACGRPSAPDYSIEPVATASSGQRLDVLGGPGPSAYVDGNPIQLWPDNGADNQILSLNPSPGQPGDEPAPPSSPGC